MYQAIIILHVVIALFIVVLILLQQGRGAEAGTAFGGGASGTVFGARGAASFLTRTTAALAALFFCSSLALAYLSDPRQETKDIMDESELVQPIGDLPALLPEESVDEVSDLPSVLPSTPTSDPANSNVDKSSAEDSATDMLPSLPEK